MPEAFSLQALLDERSAALARRRVEAIAAVETHPYLVCAAGSECFGWSLAQVASVLPGRSCTPLPAAPPGLRGIIALSGIIVTVIDLAIALGLAPSDDPDDMGHFVRLRGMAAPIALSVDRALGIVDIDAGSIDGADPTTRPSRDLGGMRISGYAPPGSGRAVGIEQGFAVVDLPALLNRFLS